MFYRKSLPYNWSIDSVFFLSIFHLKCGIKLDSFYIIIVMNANSDNLCYTLVFLRGLFTDSAAGFLLIPLFTQFQYDNFTNLWE